MMQYVIITPVRDEEEHVQATIESITAQTVRPAEWVIVDDGSTDRTGAITDRSSAQFPWIRVIHRPNRGFRKAGGGVVDAFNEGYNSLRCSDWDFLVKLDGDLSFSPDYFERCFEKFRTQPDLGIGGGEIWHNSGGMLKLEAGPRFHVRGATKIYRRACWEALGGLMPAAGWDTIDEVKANMLGWKTRSFEDLRLIHHRLTGAADGLLHDRMKYGLVCFTCGYHPLFVLARCVYRVTRKPYVVGSLAMLFGYLKGYFTDTPQVNDERVVRYLRTQQLKRLFGLRTVWR
ncbi:MAG: glycosyltransferase family A protein [Terriglobia bacterium]|jgi:glycosyltransferase involved in cell wall biosynthesis